MNTGRFVGSRGKSASGRLEDTIVKNNLEAVTEVVRQLRLRDIGGIIVIDFIDMSNPKNRATVEEALRTELERDRTKTYVVEISPLGLVEMTRQNVTDGPREILTTKCVVCAGDGFVVSEATHALAIERRLRTLAKGSRVQAFRVEVHPRVLYLLAGPGGGRLEEIEASSRRRFFLVPAGSSQNGHVHLDHFEVVQQGKLDTLRPEAPFEEGASVDLKLVEVGLYDPSAGVGKLDGLDVVVAGSAKLVGKKVSVVVGRILDGVAFASPAGDAETPGADHLRGRGREADTCSEPQGRGEGGASARDSGRRKRSPPTSPSPKLPRPPSSRPATDADDRDGAASADGAAPAKKRTRRGTRGGRGRKKPRDGGRRPGPRMEATPQEERTRPLRGSTSLRSSRSPPSPPPTTRVETATETEPEAAGEASADGAPKRKRSRRGTRGGRKRRKPAAAMARPRKPSRGDRASGRGRGAEPERRSTCRCPSGSRTSTRGERQAG